MELYTQEDRDNLKCFKLLDIKVRKLTERMDTNARQLADLQNETAKMTDDADVAIARAERLAEELGIALPEKDAYVSDTPVAVSSLPSSSSTQTAQAPLKSYEDILAEADEVLGKDTIVGFEDILTPEEIQSAFARVDEIERQFSQVTSIWNKKDLSFLIIATALQTAKSLLMPILGEPFEPSERLPHDDPEIEATHKQALKDFQTEHSEWEMKKDELHSRSWTEILFTKVPYDKIKGGLAVGHPLSGNTHRLETFGHDPILGWLFGTANILTSTVTFRDFSSYRVGTYILPEQVPLMQVFSEAIDMIQYDKHMLVAALFAQGAHIASDEFTKRGLPVPVLTLFSSDKVRELYDQHYDYLCFTRDLKIIGKSAVFSAIINWFIGFTHGLFYNQESDGEPELYATRTRKIILLSDTIASGSSIVSACITQNLGHLDIGGILITVMRLFTDIRFILRIKEEFIQKELNKDMQKELDKLDDMYNDMFGSNG